MNFLFRLTFLCLLFSSIADAQSFKKKYKDQLEPGSKIVRSGYVYTIEKTVDKTYIYKKYYPETRQMTHLITFSNADLSTREGLNSEWMDNGKLWFTGNYKDGKKEGAWKEWTWKNNYDEGSYQNGLREGEWVNANPSGKATRRLNYKAGELHGIQQYFDEEGALKKEEFYEAGKLIREEVMDTTGTEVFRIVEQMPAFPGCENNPELDSLAYKKCAERKLLEFIYGQIKYPSMAREVGIEGKAIISFVVNKEGVIEEVEAKRGVCNAIKKECLRVINKMPVWHPGYQNGEPVKVYFTLPIKFNLK